MRSNSDSEEDLPEVVKKVKHTKAKQEKHTEEDLSKVLGEASNKNLAYELQDACELAEVLAAEARDQVGLPPTEDLESSDFEIVANEGDPLELDEEALQKIDEKFKRKKSVYQVTFKGKKMDCYSDADVQKFLSSVARQIE